MSAPFQFAADWLCTFALHSTCALALAWGCTALMRRRAIAVQEGVLRLSLWVPFASSALQLLVFGSAWPTALSLPTRPPVDITAPVAESAAAVAGLPASAASDAPVLPASALDVPWAALVVAVASLAAAIGAAWLFATYRRLRLALADRRPETDARVLCAAAEMARASGLRHSPHLSRCAGLATPIAFGWLQPEICLPTRARDLEDGSLRAMLAHEVAHLRRGDPAWMWFAAAVQALFPWQILVLPVRRRWARLVELRCDAIAARHTNPTAVARCLLDVAEWLRPDAGHPALALGMAARASSLRERVESALQGHRSRSPGRLQSFAWSGASLAALTVGGPGVQSGAEPAAPTAESLVIAPRASASDEPATASLHEAAALLLIERELLRDDVERVRADVAAHPSSELRALLAAIERRMSGLDRTSARLRARLERSGHRVR